VNVMRVGRGQAEIKEEISERIKKEEKKAPQMMRPPPTTSNKTLQERKKKGLNRTF
jgi:hypothetical protein